MKNRPAQGRTATPSTQGSVYGFLPMVERAELDLAIVQDDLKLAKLQVQIQENVHECRKWLAKIEEDPDVLPESEEE
ncbi:MAG: hypothetical protein ACYCOU_00810 [Sulfobacillus sp.]